MQPKISSLTSAIFPRGVGFEKKIQIFGQPTWLDDSDTTVIRYSLKLISFCCIVRFRIDASPSDLPMQLKVRSLSSLLLDTILRVRRRTQYAERRGSPVARVLAISLFHMEKT